MENIFKLKNISEQKRNRRGKKDGFGRLKRHRGISQSIAGTLVSANIDQEYIIKAIETNNDAMKDFLFTLGCYEDEAITVISILSDQYVVVVKDARYSIDKNLALCIII